MRFKTNSHKGRSGFSEKNHSWRVILLTFITLFMIAQAIKTQAQCAQWCVCNNSNCDIGLSWLDCTGHETVPPTITVLMAGSGCHIFSAPKLYTDCIDSCATGANINGNIFLPGAAATYFAPCPQWSIRDNDFNIKALYTI
jgi:hypothetical protein